MQRGLLTEEVEGDGLRYGCVALVEEVAVGGAPVGCACHGGVLTVDGGELRAAERVRRLSWLGNGEEMGWGSAMAEAAELAREGA